MMLALFLSIGYSKNVMAEQGMAQVGESTGESPYINSDIFKYFSMNKSEFESWNKIQREMYAKNGLAVANYTLYSQDGRISKDGTNFEDSTSMIRLCEMSEYSKQHPDLFEDITGHREAFIDAIGLKAEDVFMGVSEGDTIGELKSYLQGNVDRFDYNRYGYWTEIDFVGLENISTCRLEFTYNGYLFSIKIRERDSTRGGEDMILYDPNWRVFITNLNTGGDYTELAGTYIQVTETNNFGEEDPDYDIPSFDTMLTIVPNNQGYFVKRYCYDAQGRWVLDKFYDSEEVGLQLFYSEKREGWTSYYGDNWYYLDAVSKGNRMELMGDGEGVVYKKIKRDIKSEVIE